MAEVVLDASAILARALGEPGGERVDDVIDGAWISTVNLAEVAQRLVDRGLDDVTVSMAIDGLPCRADAFDRAAALGAALLRRATRHRGLSLGDHACLELAIRKGLPVLTTDRAWAKLDLGVEVVLIR
jgi:PIN domain nuclease of toxin-antitoxin system